MRYKTLPQTRAHEVLDRMDPPNEERPDVAAVEIVAGTGEQLDETPFLTLRDQLLQLRDHVGGNTQRFDSEACVMLHQTIPPEPELLSDDGFWRWLALGALQEIVTWRFPPAVPGNAPGEVALPKLNRQNFGVGPSARQRAECYPYKLWLRAELGEEPGAGDRYRFARRGDVDFWTSHIHRQSYTTNRALCSVIVRFQYPDALDGRPRLIPGTEKVAEGVRGIRTLAKRVRRLQASCELSVIAPEQLEELIGELAEDLTRTN